MKTIKRTLTIILAVAIIAVSNVIPVSATSTSFKDVKTTAWYYNYVNELINLKITSGIGNNKYGPDNSVTKAEFVTFLCKANGLAQADGYTFTDTEKHWSSKWISAAVTANIIDQGTTFNPNKAITRQEAVEMLCRALNLKADTTMITPYKDVKVDAGYSNTAYKEYLMQGSIEKDGRYFKSTSSITRAETAAVIVNLVDYKQNSESYKTAKKAEMENKDQKDKETKEEAVRYVTWQQSVKNMSSELLKNTNGLFKPSMYESYKYLRIEELDYFKNWGAKYNMTSDQFEKEIVKVGSEYADTWANANYNKLDELESSLKSLWEKNVINNYLKKNLDYVKNNTLVSQGYFMTSTGMLVFADFGNPVLRGTLKCKYSSPTSTSILNADTVESTGKHLQLRVWYEQDFEIHFLPEDKGLKVTSMNAVSGIRISK